MPYSWDIVEGNVPGHSSINKFGHNGNVAATLETIWSAGGVYPYMAIADQLEVLSSNDEDGGAGGDTGALTMQIFGLDTNYDQIDETVTLNGVTVVTTTASFLRVFRAKVLTAGATGWNIGVITIRDQDTDTTRASIEATKNQTLMAVYTVPADMTGFITSWYMSTISNLATEVELYVRPFGSVLQVKRHFHIIQDIFAETIDFPEKVTEKSDIEVRALSAGGGGDVSAGFFMWIEEN